MVLIVDGDFVGTVDLTSSVTEIDSSSATLVIFEDSTTNNIGRLGIDNGRNNRNNRNANTDRRHDRRHDRYDSWKDGSGDVFY